MAERQSVLVHLTGTHESLDEVKSDIRAVRAQLSGLETRAAKGEAR